MTDVSSLVTLLTFVKEFTRSCVYVRFTFSIFYLCPTISESEKFNYLLNQWETIPYKQNCKKFQSQNEKLLNKTCCLFIFLVIGSFKSKTKYNFFHYNKKMHMRKKNLFSHVKISFIFSQSF